MTQSKHIFYFDALRAFAILCVVLLHVTGHLAELMNYNITTIYSFDGFFELFATNFFRMGVDLFLFMSGALLLGRDWEMVGFFKKRLPRIIKPFLFWSLVSSIILIGLSYFVPSIDFVSQFGIYDMALVFWNTLMCSAPGSAVYWYFWTILGLYLIMPIFNEWIKNSDLSKIEYFFVIWIITIVLDYTLMLDYPVKLSDFTTPVGLAVMGYYLRYTERNIFNNRNWALLLIAIPNIIMFVYSYAVLNDTILFVFHRYSLMVIIEAIGVFCLFKTSSLINNSGDLTQKIVSSIAVCSYGMYLIHSQIIMAVRKILHIHLNFYMEYILLFLAGFIISWIIIYILSKIPYLNEFVGVK